MFKPNTNKCNETEVRNIAESMVKCYENNIKVSKRTNIPKNADGRLIMDDSFCYNYYSGTLKCNNLDLDGIQKITNPDNGNRYILDDNFNKDTTTIKTGSYPRFGQKKDDDYSIPLTGPIYPFNTVGVL
jgi:hypothetical protein